MGEKPGDDVELRRENRSKQRDVARMENIDKMMPLDKYSLDHLTKGKTPTYQVKPVEFGTKLIQLLFLVKKAEPVRWE